MSTDELQRLERAERLLASGLRAVDAVPVDVQAGHARLPSRLAKQESVRRRAAICVAASVLAIVVTTALMLSGLRDHERSLPPGPSPELTFTPSGLPVGLVTGKIERTEPQASSTIRMIVRPDGTGVWNSATLGDSEGNSTHDFDVTFVAEESGEVTLKYFEGECFTPDVLTLEFAVHGRTLVIEKADGNGNGCLVSHGLARDMWGATLRIRPLPPGS